MREKGRRLLLVGALMKFSAFAVRKWHHGSSIKNPVGLKILSRPDQEVGNGILLLLRICWNMPIIFVVQMDGYFHFLRNSYSEPTHILFILCVCPPGHLISFLSSLLCRQLMHSIHNAHLLLQLPLLLIPIYSVCVYSMHQLLYRYIEPPQLPPPLPTVHMCWWMRDPHLFLLPSPGERKDPVQRTQTLSRTHTTQLNLYFFLSFSFSRCAVIKTSCFSLYYPLAVARPFIVLKNPGIKLVCFFFFLTQYSIDLVSLVAMEKYANLKKIIFLHH